MQREGCRRLVGSSRYPFVWRAVDLFKNMGKFSCWRGIQKSGGGGLQEFATPMLTRVGYWRSRGRSVHKEGSPESLPPSFSTPFHSLDHSFSTGKLEATGSYAPSLARVHRAAFCCCCQCTGCTLHARGEVLVFRKIQRILLPRTYLCPAESQFRERVSKESWDVYGFHNL